MRRWSGAALALFAASVSASCGGSEDAAGSGGAGGSDAGTFFWTGACGTCLDGECGAAVAACSAEPSCAAYLSCVKACPAAASGGVDIACEAACPKAAGSAAEAAQKALRACVSAGGNGKCTTCDATPIKSALPILNQQCPASTDPNACYKCEDEHCCDTYAACANDADCQSFKGCMKDCTSPKYSECFDSCEKTQPAGAEKFIERMACVNAYCLDTCGGVPLDNCVKCNLAKCLDPFTACNADLDCVHVQNCTAACGPTNAACVDDCRSKYPAGAPAFDAWALCGYNECLAECG